MTPAQFGLAGGVAVAAGFVNALAGGGTLLSFPTLMAIGVPPINANITNTVALCPGFVGAALAQRRDLQGQARRIWTLVPAAAIGGLAGGVLLLFSSERGFRAVVPFLILAASALLGAQEHVRAWVVRRSGSSGSGGAAGRAAGPIGLAAIYGGYFGAGLSVIVLATLGVLVDDTLTRLNALKQTIALAANFAALLLFVFSGQVLWPLALVMAVGALLGGALGGRLARMIPPATLRRAVVIVGVVVGVLYLI
jgi:uncharacterized membrane protein YfcA